MQANNITITNHIAISSMAQEIKSQIENDFAGFNDGAVFKLTNGQVWQQSRYRYWYHYAYRPHVRIYEANGETLLEVVGTSETVPVRQVSIVVEGPIVSEFKGFDGGAIFEFQNGQMWEQAEHRYRYRYVHRPHAMVVDGMNGKEIHIDGMSEAVRVRKIN